MGGALHKVPKPMGRRFNCQEAYSGLHQPIVHTFDVWWNAKGMAGFELVNCSSLKI